MAGGAGVGAGLGIMGGILGGVGDIIQAQNYHRPHLEPATGREKRLRDLAQSQLLGAGQQTLGGAALYNQMAPILLSQLPGMQYIPGSMGEGGGPGSSGAGNYGQALGNYQQRQGLQQQLVDLNHQLQAAKKGPQKKQLRQQRNALKKQVKGMPTVAEDERRMYQAGMQPGSFDIRQAAPTSQPTLGSIQSLLSGLNSGPSFTDIYNSAAG